jgi:TATA-binding protein-associated factor Taf7
LPITATPPPMAIMQALAKKAVPCRKLSISVASKMRGWRVTKVRIQSRRYSSIAQDTEGSDRGGCSLAQPEP